MWGIVQIVGFWIRTRAAYLGSRVRNPFYFGRFRPYDHRYIFIAEMHIPMGAIQYFKLPLLPRFEIRWKLNFAPFYIYWVVKNGHVPWRRKVASLFPYSKLRNIGHYVATYLIFSTNGANYHMKLRYRKERRKWFRRLALTVLARWRFLSMCLSCFNFPNKIRTMLDIAFPYVSDLNCYTL